MSLTGNAEGFERTRKRWKACATVNSLCIFYRGQRSQNPWLNNTNTWDLLLLCLCVVCLFDLLVFLVSFYFSLCVFYFLRLFPANNELYGGMSDRRFWVVRQSVCCLCVCVFLLVFLRHVCVCGLFESTHLVPMLLAQVHNTTVVVCRRYTGKICP